MIVAGIILAVLAFLAVAAFVGDGLRDQNAGVFPGFIAAVWAAWPFFHCHFVARHAFLHPALRRYAVDLPTAFSTIREILRETVYDYGDRWHVATADTSINRIVADLSYCDEYQKTEVVGKLDFRARTERVRRRIRLEVRIEPEASHASIVELDFYTYIEGAHRTACDAIISELTTLIEDRLGPGHPVGPVSPPRLPAPPWWLIGASACSVLVLFKQVCEVVF